MFEKLLLKHFRRFYWQGRHRHGDGRHAAEDQGVVLAGHSSVGCGSREFEV